MANIYAHPGPAGSHPIDGMEIIITPATADVSRGITFVFADAEHLLKARFKTSDNSQPVQSARSNGMRLIDLQS